jgi:hypothetical protein
MAALAAAAMGIVVPVVRCLARRCTSPRACKPSEAVVFHGAHAFAVYVAPGMSVGEPRAGVAI